MSNQIKSLRRLFVVMLAIGIFSLSFPLQRGLASTADGKVREGIRFFGNGEYEAAGKAFTEADVAEPENPTITFDRACGLVATKDLEKARELFRQVALARDVDLAARSHYNLGTLSATEGRSTLGDDPVAATAEQRQQGLSLLLSAVQHYRDCLQLVADHSDSRHNLELIRLFIKHIESQWEKQDKEKAREEKNLLEFLAMLQQRQRELRATAQTLSREVDSPQKRQALAAASASQGELREEIEPLQAKIAEQFQATQQAQTSSGSPVPGAAAATPNPQLGPQLEQAEQLLTELAAGAGGMMLEATAAMAAGELDEARAKQRDVLDQLNQIFMAVAPFSNVLQRAIEQQEQLTETSDAWVQAALDDPASAVESTDEVNTEATSTDQATSGAAPAERQPIEPEWPELEWRQSRVSDWSRLLSLKAKSELPGVEAQLQSAGAASPGADPSQTPAPSQAGGANDPASAAATADDPQAQLEALQQSLQKAIELAPQVEQLSSAAALHLGKADSAAALPDQEKAEELLREIGKPLEQQNQQEQQQGDQSGDQSGDQQDQQNQNENGEQPDQQPPADSDDQPTAGSPQERAMSTLRRARQREQQHRDLTKQLQQMTGGRAQVDRDW